jgi:hypothetical protein
MSDLDMDIDLGLANVQTNIEVPEIETKKYEPMKPGEVAGPYNCMVIDTLNELQDLQYIQNLEAKGKADFQAYIDLNVNVKIVTNLVKKYFEEVVLIIGKEGSGKSYGIKHLDPRRTIWLNTDDKPVTFKGRSNWSPKQRNMIRKIYDYKTLHTHIHYFAKQQEKGVPFVVFMLGHLAKDKESGNSKLKTIGKFSEQLNLDGAVTNCYYTGVISGPEKNQYYLDTQNNGANSARCVEELFPTKYIPNNFEYIRELLVNY